MQLGIALMSMIVCSARALCRNGLWCTPIRFNSKFNSLKMSIGQVQPSILNVRDHDDSVKPVYYLDRSNSQDAALPPLVVLGGTAQTIDTYAPHINQIAKTRRLIIPELRGQGRTELDPLGCSLLQLTDDLSNILDGLGVEQVDLSGFSFGGRVALAYAAHNPHRVRKLAVTAIPLTRPVLGKLVLESWMDGLKRGNIRECAWSFLINGYSNDFLERNADRLPLYVDMVAMSNDPHKVYNLIYHSGKATNQDDPFSIPHCADHIRCPTLVIGAAQDRIAGVEPVRQLARRIAGSEYVEMNTGHLAPFEDPLVWRRHLLDFMNKPL